MSSMHVLTALAVTCTVLREVELLILRRVAVIVSVTATATATAGVAVTTALVLTTAASSCCFRVRRDELYI